MIPDGLVQIGSIVGAHGIDGVVKVYSYAESPDRFTAQNHLTVIDSKGRQTRMKPLWARPHKKIVRLALEGITTRDQAEALVGSNVCITKEDLPELEEDAYYWIDLIGLSVYTTAGDYLGRVEEIIPTGANDVYVVKTPADHSAGLSTDEILVPAIASVVIDIDIENGRMEVALPEGLV